MSFINIHKKPIDDFKECPHCHGTSGYYIRQMVSGIITDQHTFEGHPENHNMHDSLKYTTISKWYRCLDCDKPIIKI